MKSSLFMKAQGEEGGLVGQTVNESLLANFPFTTNSFTRQDTWRERDLKHRSDRFHFIRNLNDLW